MNPSKDIYYHHKISLGKLLKENGLEIMSKDIEVIDRIFNLLTENKDVENIEGLISTTEIVKYGGDIEDSKVEIIFDQIQEWFEKIIL